MRLMKWALLMLCIEGSALAQDNADILIGTSMPLSGPNASAGQEGLAVVKAYFDSVNKSGGIGGRKLALTALDDEFKPQKAAENAQTLANSKAVAIFNCWGTSSCSAMMPVITEAGIPMVAGLAGGGPMRAQPGRFAFNIRPATDREITRMLGQMTSTGQSNIALVYQNDPFGKSGQAATQGVFAKAGLKPAAEIPIEGNGTDVPAVIEALRKLSNLNGIILIAAPPVTVKLIPLARKSGLAAQFYNLAAQATQKVVNDLGEATGGVVFTTLAPNPWKEGIPVVKEYQQIYSAATGKQEYSYLGMEVFINAKVLVEGLRKAGRTLTRETLVTALETMGERRYGPLNVQYAPGDREGSSYVGLTIINRSGRFVE